MQLSTISQRILRSASSDRWVSGSVGALLTAGLLLYYYHSVGPRLSWAVIGAGLVGGFVAGGLLGTNWLAGSILGLKVGVFGGILSAVGFGAFLVTVWYIESGMVIAQVPFTYFAIIFLGLAPVSGLFGAIGGGVGVALRRFTLPREYNPPPR